MTEDNNCKHCHSQMLHIPIRKIDDLIMVEDYCPSCEESHIRYESIGYH